MFKVAIIADIHGNLPALEATLQDLEAVAPDQVLVAGDLVGRGPQSLEVLQRIAVQDWPVIQGNHEAFWVDCGRGDTPPEWHNGWWSPTRQELNRLPAQWIDWMDALPDQHVIEVDSAPPVLVVHGSPNRLNEGLYEQDTDDQVEHILRGTPYPVVVGAHTHVPMDRRTARHWVLNTGSIGAPFNGDPAAQYLVLTWDGTAWQSAFRQASYDYKKFLAYWHSSGYYDTGVAAQVFAYEIETASFHFWHYVRYAEASQLPLNDPASFTRYRREFPAYAAFCMANDLPVGDETSLQRYQQARPGKN